MSDFKSKNFDTLEEGYHQLAKENERLRALLADARAALAPFAGSARNISEIASDIHRWSTDQLRVRDFRRACKFMEESENA